MKTTLPSTAIDNVVSKILPVFGTKGLDVPIFDKDKHMYLVDQFQFESGNRTLTYVAVSDYVIAEVVYGHYHGWEYMNRLRVLAADGTNMKVISTREWPQSTRTDLKELKAALAQGLADYITSSPLAKGFDKDAIRQEAEKMASDLFGQTEDYLDTPVGRQVLMAYCEKCNYCRDLVRFV